MADQRGSTPTPVIPTTWGADGNTPTPVSATAPLPVDVVSSIEEEPLTDAASSQVTVAVDESPSVVLAAADPLRTMLWFYNDGPNTVYLNKDAAAVSTTGQPLVMGGTLILSGAEAKKGWQGICAAAETAVIRRQFGVTS